jgi:holo-[acyl-carrier protein] synthase
MIVGLGIDQIEIARVAKTLARYNERFGRRVYTQGEWQYCLSRPNPAQSLAGRFAAKEAVMKALGLGWPGGIAYRDIEITRELTGKPGIRLSNRAAHRATQLGVSHCTVSMTHDRTHSSATVILERP